MIRLLSNNISFKASITDKEIDEIKNAKQHFSDCYLISTLESFTQTETGREILKQQVQRDDTNPYQINLKLFNKNGQKELYKIPTNIVLDNYKKLYKYQPNDIIRSFNISLNEHEKRYKDKPLICQIRDNFKTYKFEYNLPSNFMKMLTGIEPRVIGESDININLVKYKKEVLELLKKMQEEKNYNFVISTGIKPLNGHYWHVYTIQDVNLEKNTITIKEKRENTPTTMSIDKALKTFKFIAGYLDSDLQQYPFEHK